MPEALRIIPLGGLGEVGKNMTVYELGGDAIVVDAGLAFPRDEHLGVDLILPDFSYLQERRAPTPAGLLPPRHEDYRRPPPDPPPGDDRRGGRGPAAPARPRQVHPARERALPRP